MTEEELGSMGSEVDLALAELFLEALDEEEPLVTAEMVLAEWPPLIDERDEPELSTAEAAHSAPEPEHLIRVQAGGYAEQHLLHKHKGGRSAGLMKVANSGHLAELLQAGEEPQLLPVPAVPRSPESSNVTKQESRTLPASPQARISLELERLKEESRKVQERSQAICSRTEALEHELAAIKAGRLDQQQEPLGTGRLPAIDGSARARGAAPRRQQRHAETSDWTGRSGRDLLMESKAPCVPAMVGHEPISKTRGPGKRVVMAPPQDHAARMHEKREAQNPGMTRGLRNAAGVQDQNKLTSARAHHRPTQTQSARPHGGDRAAGRLDNVSRRRSGDEPVQHHKGGKTLHGGAGPQQTRQRAHSTRAAAPSGGRGSGLKSNGQALPSAGKIASAHTLPALPASMQEALTAQLDMLSTMMGMPPANGRGRAGAASARSGQLPMMDPMMAMMLMSMPMPMLSLPGMQLPGQGGDAGSPQARNRSARQLPPDCMLNPVTEAKGQPHGVSAASKTARRGREINAEAGQRMEQRVQQVHAQAAQRHHRGRQAVARG